MIQHRCRRWLIASIAVLAVILLHGTPAVAAEPECPSGTYELQVPLPGLANCLPYEGGSGTYIEAWYRLLLTVTAIIAVVMIIIGGIRWAVAFGDSSKITLAQETIREALIGLILMLTSITLLTFVNPKLATIGDFGKATAQPIGTSQLTVPAKPQPTVQTINNTAFCTNYCFSETCTQGYEQTTGVGNCVLQSGSTDTCIPNQTQRPGWACTITRACAPC